MQRNFSPPTEKPLAKAVASEVKAAAKLLMSSWESYIGGTLASLYYLQRNSSQSRASLVIEYSLERVSNQAYLKGGGAGLQTREVSSQNTGLVELARAHQAGKESALYDRIVISDEDPFGAGWRGRRVDR